MSKIGKIPQRQPIPPVEPAYRTRLHTGAPGDFLKLIQEELAKGRRPPAGDDEVTFVLFEARGKGANHFAAWLTDAWPILQQIYDSEYPSPPTLPAERDKLRALYEKLQVAVREVEKQLG